VGATPLGEPAPDRYGVLAVSPERFQEETRQLRAEITRLKQASRRDRR
jgi:hypothetical protein